jgi:alkanesulfonate monooxygenase SsuD/methylene tetrahydromethanopterin reductase-like flavin-dependent oxidoreductase (luciferase family)
MCVTDNGDEVRGMIATFLDGYNDLPSYRGVMDAEGAGGPADVSLVGTAKEVRAGIAAFEEAGATEFAPVEFVLNPDDTKATRELLVDVARNGI